VLATLRIDGSSNFRWPREQSVFRQSSLVSIRADERIRFDWAHDPLHEFCQLFGPATGLEQQSLSASSWEGGVPFLRSVDGSQSGVPKAEQPLFVVQYLSFPMPAPAFFLMGQTKPRGKTFPHETLFRPGPSWGESITLLTYTKPVVVRPFNVHIQ
jgi:hypothetical protein